MKITRGHNLNAFLASVFKRVDKSQEYFKRKYKYLVNFYLRFYRCRRHSVVGHVLKFRGKRAVIAHNVLRIKGGLSKMRRRTYNRVFYGLPITTRPKRKSKSWKNKKQKERLPLQLQNVSSTTRPTICEKVDDNEHDGSIAQKEDAGALASAAKSIVIANSGKIAPKTVTHGDQTPPDDEFNENSTNNIWNLDLATVALEMTDENLKSVDEDEPNHITNGSSGKVCIENENQFSI